MESTLTKNQSLTLEFIRHSQERNGVGPSYQEITDMLGLKAKSGAHRVIHQLIERGRLRKRFGTSRQYEIVDQSNDVLIGLLKEAAPYVQNAQLRTRILKVVSVSHAA